MTLAESAVRNFTLLTRLYITALKTKGKVLHVQNVGNQMEQLPRFLTEHIL